MAGSSPRPAGDVEELETHFGNLDELLDPYEPGRLIEAARHDYVVEANWKLLVENYHECYHCTSIHPALCKVSPPDSGVDLVPTGRWCGGPMELADHAETMSFDGKSHGLPLPGLDPQQLRKVLYVGLFPNLLISAHPDYVMTAPPDAARRRSHRGGVQSGCSRPRRERVLVSTPLMPSTSGTSPTERTGRPARGCSAG